MKSFFTGSETPEEYASKRAVMEQVLPYVDRGQNPHVVQYMRKLEDEIDVVRRTIVAKQNSLTAADTPASVYNFLDVLLNLSGHHHALVMSNEAVAMISFLILSAERLGAPPIDPSDPPDQQLSTVLQACAGADGLAIVVETFAQGRNNINEYLAEMSALPPIWT